MKNDAFVFLKVFFSGLAILLICVAVVMAERAWS
jgi:hypothetical protein